MYINKITMKNFRQYKNTIIDFSIGDDRNIFPIIGANGYGKTTFVNAIAWCLYGKESNRSRNKGLMLLNNIANIDNENEIEVSLFITDRQNNKFQITRTLNTDNNKPQLNILYKSADSNEFSPVSDTGIFIEKHFPESIIHYFLFDGEMLEEYFQNDNEKIKKEVYNLSNIELLDKINTHTKTVLTEIREKVKYKKIVDINSIDTEIKKIEQNIDEQTKLLKKNESDLNVAEHNREELTKKLQGIPDISYKEKLLESFENTSQTLKRNRDDSEIELYSTLIKEAPYILTITETNKITAELSTKITKGEIPPMYKKDFLKNILDENICICGRELDLNSKDLLNRLYNNTKEETNISDDLSVLYHTLKDFDDSHINKFIDTMKTLHTKEDNEMKEYNKILKNIEDIKLEIAGYDSERIKSWQQELDKYQDEIAICNRTTGTINNKLASLHKEFATKWKEYDAAVKNNDITKGYQNEMEFTKNVIEEVKILKDNITNGMKQKIEEKTKDIFLKIIEKEQTFKEVSISDDYSFSVKDINDEECLGTMSAGERESLALSFIAALNDITGIDVPIIIDTLLGRLDPNVKENIAKMFHNIFTDTQVVLLVTESEFTEEFKDKIMDKCSDIFKLNFHEYSNGAYTEVNRIECR